MHIVFAESSDIVVEGLVGILTKSGLKFQISKAKTFDDIEICHSRKNCDLIFINPSLIHNNSKVFNALKCQLQTPKWVGLVYSFHDQQILSLLDAIITISDSPETIISLVKSIINNDPLQEHKKLLDVLSEREIDVLKLVATGLANKEIADKLNISIHTVITHRKNISQKIGIKSVSGLTIYAVVKKFISLETITE